MNKKFSSKACNGKVCKVNDNDKKILQNLYESREGLRVKTIIKLTSLKQSHIYKRLNILKEKGLIENIFPIWKILNGQVDFCRTLIESSNIFELHNISYVVKLMKVPSWWSKRKNYLMRLKGWQFKNILWGKGASNTYQQLMNDNFVIQAYPESLIIISRKRYYSNNPYETICNAMSDVLDLLEWFCERSRFNFFADGVPHIQVRNNDFNRMNDALAKEVRKEKGKFLVEIDQRRKVWVDMSEPFGKEANYPSGQEKLEKRTRDVLTKDSLLPSELTAFAIRTENQISHVTENQMVFDRNMKSHLDVLKKLGNAVDELKKEIKKIARRK